MVGKPAATAVSWTGEKPEHRSLKLADKFNDHITAQLMPTATNQIAVDRSVTALPKHDPE